MLRLDHPLVIHGLICLSLLMASSVAVLGAVVAVSVWATRAALAPAPAPEPALASKAVHLDL